MKEKEEPLLGLKHWFFLAWAFVVTMMIVGVFFFPDAPSRLEDAPRHLARVISFESYGYFLNHVDKQNVRYDPTTGILSDARTAFSMKGSEIQILAEDCATEVLMREPLYVVTKLCNIVFVIAHDKSIRAIMRDDVYLKCGEVILEGIRDDVPRHFCQILDGKPFLHFDVAVNRSWIHHDLKNRTVTDAHTGFQEADDRLVDLGKRCMSRVIFKSDGLTAIGLCDVVFVVGDDWVVHGIVTEQTFNEIGGRILIDIKSSISEYAKEE